VQHPNMIHFKDKSA